MRPSSTRSDMPLIATLLVATAAACGLLAGRAVGVTAGLVATVMLLMAWLIWRRELLLRLTLERLENIGGAGDGRALPGRLTAAIGHVRETHAALELRLKNRHAISGLPTREPLIEQMISDGSGTLGAISFSAYDRVCAFDPAQGERVLLALIDRLSRMISRDRMIAHVDRAALALWYGPDTASEAARAEIDALAYALGDMVQDGDQTIVPEIRVRIASFPDDHVTPQVLLARTVAALSLKPLALSSVAEKPLDTAAAARERYAIEQDLRQAIGRNEFKLLFQPLIDSTQERVVGAEALIRWQSPRHGQVPPSRFVPIAEAAGLADELGLWTLNAATRAAREWRARGASGLRVAVNVSGHQLERDDLPTLVARTLARHGLGSDALEIELTESVAASDDTRAAALFEALHGLGVSIAIDDFGTGFSSFSSLRKLTFDKLKIDREFVTAVDTRRDSQAICQSIIALGRGLGIRVLAEGLERREEYEWLRSHGCQHFQGFYFSPPLDGDAFLKFAQDGRGLAARLAVGAIALRSQLSERLSA